MLLNPVRHVRIINCPRVHYLLVFLPSVFLAVEELMSVAFVFYDIVTFDPVLVPVVVLLSVPVPLLGPIDSHHAYPDIFVEGILSRI